MSKFDEVKNILQKYGQEHLIGFYNELSEKEREALLDSILGIDFELCERLYKMAEKGEKPDNGNITPIGCVVKNNLTAEKTESYKKAGLEIMRSGGFATVTMAGGQGTRLGHNGPKGTYDIGLDSHMSLFEIQAMRLKKKKEELGVYIPWYIMTSRENDADTRDFFEQNNYFGYDRKSVKFFTQCMLPMIDTDGKLILASKSKIKEGADGHGGIFRAMIASGIVDDMKSKNVKWIYVGGIDNVLGRIADPVFTGLMEESGNLIGGKSLIKRDPYEKAGVFCLKDAKPYVVEYTEISDEMAKATDADGKYIYGDAHILCNMFNIAVFDKMGDKGLPYHTAFKKTAYINENGDEIKPDTPNAYKFEAFIFDAFNFFNDMTIFRINREEDFAPVKNKEGEDSPQTARDLFNNCGEDIY